MPSYPQSIVIVVACAVPDDYWTTPTSYVVHNMNFWSYKYHEFTLSACMVFKGLWNLSQLRAIQP